MSTHTHTHSTWAKPKAHDKELEQNAKTNAKANSTHKQNGEKEIQASIICWSDDAKIEDELKCKIADGTNTNNLLFLHWFQAVGIDIIIIIVVPLKFIQ